MPYLDPELMNALSDVCHLYDEDNKDAEALRWYYSMLSGKGNEREKKVAAEVADQYRH
jgi:hypothetical protein